MSQGLTKYDSDGADMSPQDDTKNILTQIAAAMNRLAGIPGITPVPSIPVVPAGGVVRTFALTAATGNGSVSAGTKSVAFSSSSDFAGTIASATFGASQTTGASVDGADTIGAIAYTVSAGTLYIATLT